MNARNPDPESLRSAYEWLTAQADPDARLVGYFGLLKLGGPDQLDVAVRLLDLLVHEVTAHAPRKRRRRKGDRHLLCEAPERPSRQKVPVTFSARFSQSVDANVHELPAGRPVDLNSAARALGEAARLLDRAGRLAGYFESLLRRAEAQHDATFLLRHAWVTGGCAAVADAATRRRFLRRLIALIDAGAYQSDHAAAARTLRQHCQRQLADRAAQ